MNTRHFVFAPLLLQSVRAAESFPLPEAERLDYGYQLYQEDNQRIRVESSYLRGQVDINADTAVRFQLLRDAISGSSPTGELPGETDFFKEMHDVRTGVLAALARQFGDHRLDLEISRSVESDYDSHGYSLSDTWDLNQKNTTLAFGVNYLSDKVAVPGIQRQDKTGLEWFTGLTQLIDKNTVVSANFTLGSNHGYLNDPYKVIDRNEVLDLGIPGVPLIPLVTPYNENRPNHRLREVLQLDATHFFEAPNAALDTVYRLSHDDYGVVSQFIQIQWRQAVGSHVEVTPYLRYYRQNAAKFFMNSLDGVFPLSYNPPDHPNGTGPNYSADYRLSALDALSLGLRLTYTINTHFSLSTSYERYAMEGLGGNAAPAASYPSANIWSLSASAKF